MKKLYYLMMAMAATLGCTSCNNEWEDEQFVQMASLKAVPGDDGVTPVYLRYNTDGEKVYELPVLISGSTLSEKSHVVHVVLDEDTLEQLNKERYGEREELHYKLLDGQYYSFPETVEVPAGEAQAILPINFTLGGKDNQNPLDLSDKWILPLTVAEDPSYDYIANPRKHYRKALLNITPFNDYSGTYDGTQYKIYMEGDQSKTFTLNTHRAYVYDDKTIFFYMGLRTIDYVDRKNYKVFVEFTDEIIDIQKKKLRIWSDNDGELGNNFKIGENQSYYTIEESDDPKQPYLHYIYITLYLDYTFEDYTTIDGQRLHYQVAGTLTMQRDLNTLIPDEDQQIQW